MEFNRFSKRILAISFILALITMFTISCAQRPDPKETDLLHIQSTEDKATAHRSKPVIVFLVDSLLSSSIDEGVRQGMLPTFRQLIDRGQYYPQFVSSFPTMSVTIDSTLLTGTYPDKHRIPGLVWYSAAEQRMINYGSGYKDLLKRGVNPFLEHAFVELNGQHLNRQTPTIYEDLAEKGFQSGSVNGLVYRGNTEHQLHFPKWLEAPTKLPRSFAVQAPDLFTFGAFSNPLEGYIDLKDDLLHRMGLDNQYAVDVATYLIQHRKVPDLLLVYLPDLDQKLHRHGPAAKEGMDGLRAADEQLRSILQQYGSMDEALRQAVIIIMGDSGVSQVLPGGEQPTINLPMLFQSWNVNRPGDPVTPDTDLVIAANETMSYLYAVNDRYGPDDFADILMKDDRIDFMAWQENGWIYVRNAGTGRELRYHPGGKLVDPYGQAWTVENDESVLDLERDEAGLRITYGDYPDGLQRLYAALHSHEGVDMIITTKLGYEFADYSSTTHEGGGAHGSLHRIESLIPVIIAGTDSKPSSERIVDFKSYLRQLVTGNAQVGHPPIR
ncbi:putative AlkP superfamily pyrophosphatase or phosphodiesterase [Paenibacillus phyllosphaerae]|uniref:Putative AlkP superfamily pyrophosphatase or phosphodiesterase n=1 Tax=Paenibacillus phyllosphaerae TaxID=274593 RepID=A0A7W5AZL8_9BACL|nr:alkaline phosphatase family protein [Paenibacillus phyllosphaerae]MBB3111709.1 putative AlkP superfamily pyrophosphatase or phosphodiesterase [Paenibacillus phyllosphaerae]